ncbi:MAG: M48 family metallopeptidase [Rhodobacter sp.]|nr:M48 family metallopeptidase [Rhodobacter sp.]
MRSAALAILTSLALAACAVAPPAPAPAPRASGDLPSPQQAADNFAAVVRKVEPVAERFCQAETPRQNCDFLITVDTTRRQPPNAFQTVDRAGRPVIVLTVALVAEVRNRDEMAFVLGHEAAHHIRGHIPRQQQSAVAGAVLGGILASIGGAGADAVRTAQDIGASVGARAYSKEFELEADALGTLIAYHAGYDPVVGAEYFNRIADPGNVFLGTHPPNDQRIETVRRTAAGLN